MLQELIDEIIIKNRIVIKYRQAGDELDDTDRQYLKGFSLYDHTDLPDSYLQTADSIEILSDDLVLGGVLFQQNVEMFRTSLLCNEMMQVQTVVPRIEMNGLWLSDKCPALVRLGFWAVVAQKICSYPNQAVIFSYDLKKRKLDEWYRSLGGMTLYEGPVRQLEGMAGDAIERVACFNVNEFSENIDLLFVRKILSYLTKES